MIERKDLNKATSCLSDIFRVHVPTYNDIRKRVLEVFVEKVFIPRSVRRQGKDRAKIFRYMLKCENTYKVLVDTLGPIARLPRTSQLHPFLSELANIATDGRYDEFIERTAKALKIISNLWREYRSKILASYTPGEAKSYAREFVGRALSIAKRFLKDFEKFRSAIKSLKSIPCIDPALPTIIIAGMPQVGKSTLVHRISSAKPEIAPYPFTTKTIILGHMDLDTIRIQIIDTPGILDRPVDEMNPIERKAVAALRNLNALTLYLIDPSRDAYYSLDKQLSVLRNVSEIVGSEKLYVVINKIDKVDTARLSEVKKHVEALGFSILAEISALKGIGIDTLISKIIELLGLSGLVRESSR